MLAFLLMLLTMAALIGGGVLIHMYLYSQGAFAPGRTFGRVRRSRPMVQRALAQQEVVGDDLEAMLGIDVEAMTDPLSRLMRRFLLVLSLAAILLVAAAIFLLNIVLR